MLYNQRFVSTFLHANVIKPVVGFSTLFSEEKGGKSVSAFPLTICVLQIKKCSMQHTVACVFFWGETGTKIKHLHQWKVVNCTFCARKYLVFGLKTLIELRHRDKLTTVWLDWLCLTLPCQSVHSLSCHCCWFDGRSAPMVVINTASIVGPRAKRSLLVYH